MQRIELGQWILDYDRIETMESYKSKNAKEQCSCISCKNFYYSAPNFNNNIKKFFENFGIDSRKPIEVYDYGGVGKNRKIQYGGFYYIVGKIIKKVDFNSLFYWTKIADDFDVAFDEGKVFADENFPENCFTMSISLWTDWVLDEKDDFKALDDESKIIYKIKSIIYRFKCIIIKMKEFIKNA